MTDTKVKTKFVLKEMIAVMPDGKELTFWFDGNGKITAGNGTFADPVPNAFSLVQVEDCPFSTPTCQEVCYVHLLEKAEIEVHEKFRSNSLNIRKVLKNPDYFQSTVEAFASWITINCSKGFRWHVSGDIFSLTHSRFIASVCRIAPDVSFWIYSRSFDYLDQLYMIDNLVVNLSADCDNVDKARITNQVFGFRICYLTMDGALPEYLPKGSVIFPSHSLRGRDLAKPTDASWWQSLSLEERKMVCPPDFFGQGEKRRCGPCQKCLV